MSSESRARFLPERRLPRRRIALLLGASAAAGAALVTPAQAQQAGYGQTLGTTPMEQQIYDGGTGKSGSGSILDSTNPLDLLNKLRRGTAMDDATPPSSAIDQALQQLEAQSSSAASPAGSGALPPPAGGSVPKATTPTWTVPGSPAGNPATPPQTLVWPTRQAP